MTKTNKAFAYITNTARGQEGGSCLERIFLFNSCIGLKQRLNVSTKILSVLTAYLIHYYPQLKELSLTAPIVTPVKGFLRAADIPNGTPVFRASGTALTAKKKSESRHVVAFMKVFFEDGFMLVPTADAYRDQVLDAGRRAEGAVMGFLKSQNINVKGAGSVLRALRPLHKSGILDERIAAHKRLLAIGSIADPTSADTQDILNVVGHV
ncbi:Hypothetical protein PHPALM_13880 [Phytophthora palmivora]|uniref:Uncharacterized protein n=1 Tax=Phytophthora palmivora TaxID=4796 RepID=A0A2P4XW68_9STRA|nr:Hypothetical protein PHPALM_13880 [Phytophthora palmivora]